MSPTRRLATFFAAATAMAVLAAAQTGQDDKVSDAAREFNRLARFLEERAPRAVYLHDELGARLVVLRDVPDVRKLPMSAVIDTANLLDEWSDIAADVRGLDRVRDWVQSNRPLLNQALAQKLVNLDRLPDAIAGFEQAKEGITAFQSGKISIPADSPLQARVTQLRAEWGIAAATAPPKAGEDLVGTWRRLDYDARLAACTRLVPSKGTTYATTLEFCMREASKDGQADGFDVSALATICAILIDAK